MFPQSEVILKVILVAQFMVHTMIEKWYKTTILDNNFNIGRHYRPIKNINP